MNRHGYAKKHFIKSLDDAVYKRAMGTEHACLNPAAFADPHETMSRPLYVQLWRIVNKADLRYQRVYQRILRGQGFNQFGNFVGNFNTILLKRPNTPSIV